MLSKIVDHAIWQCHQRIIGFAVPDSPHFEEESLPYFRERLRSSTLYLEYGCGGSTVEAARLGKSFVSVEGDRYYLEAVRKKIEKQFGPVEGTFLHADVGLTGPWGYPIFKARNLARMQRWKGYAEKPWRSLRSMPDLILIDGRFRVHCALFTISKVSDFEILFDDYGRRPHYREVEKFARLDRMYGRMAVFRPKPYDSSDLKASIAHFASDYR